MAVRSSTKPGGLRAPFPYCGGKASVAKFVWERFGQVGNFVEPFAGSMAVLLQRPLPFSGSETVNDIDGFLANFWRSIQKDPETTAKWADYPVSEVDLTARHFWLVNTGRRLVEKLKEDPDYYNPKIAGYWVWGLSQWIGTGWCADRKGKKNEDDDSEVNEQLPHLSTVQGMGVHAMGTQKTPEQMPYLGEGGVGVCGQKNLNKIAEQLPYLGNIGRGCNTQRVTQKIPGLGQKDVKGVHTLVPGQLPDMRTKGVHGFSGGGGIYGCFAALSARLRRVRIACGDWSRVCTKSPTYGNGLSGIFLDPPYALEGRTKVYTEESNVAVDVRKWCLENGDNKLLRIILCGYAGEGHEELEQHGWKVASWKATGGWALTGKNLDSVARKNANRERMWISPFCKKIGNLFS